MNKMKHSMAGVTLLEIMLVLAIAAMVIVMSVRYYQSASQSQQANTVLQMIQGITAAADGLAQGSGDYDSVTDDNVKSLMPNNSLQTPWGTTIKITKGTTSYEVEIPSTPVAVCNQIRTRLEANTQYKPPTTCSGGPFTYTYFSTPQ